ncbi:hypothetical protein A6R68_18219 [Neotoma lepida]|uniref:Uncharacterized protein n=1 Tax=Neotoma lepida TaxID=56216 RepID=A0A1A6HM88_NEOLE|nr:hypothetical protein A6R68_18219 [Neotoma lepida]
MGNTSDHAQSVEEGRLYYSPARPSTSAAALQQRKEHPSHSPPRCQCRVTQLMAGAWKREDQMSLWSFSYHTLEPQPFENSSLVGLMTMARDPEVHEHQPCKEHVHVPASAPPVELIKRLFLHPHWKKPDNQKPLT